MDFKIFAEQSIYDKFGIVFGFMLILEKISQKFIRNFKKYWKMLID
jgi:hypothetical protein